MLDKPTKLKAQRGSVQNILRDDFDESKWAAMVLYILNGAAACVASWLLVNYAFGGLLVFWLVHGAHVGCFLSIFIPFSLII